MQHPLYTLSFAIKIRSNRDHAEKAVIDGDVDKFKSLVAQGANHNHYIDIACKYGHLEMVKALVEAGADTERRGMMSPVHQYGKSI